MENKWGPPKSMHMNYDQTSFLMPFGEALDPGNRWIRLANLVPWGMVEDLYGVNFKRNHPGRRPLSARIALGALIIKERQGLTDRETVEQIRENPYLQYFLGYRSFSSAPPFDASTMVLFRKRLGADCITRINDSLIEKAQEASVSGEENDDAESDSGSGQEQGSFDPTSDQPKPPEQNAGVLMVDATCAPADITYPTDLKLLDHARRLTEVIIDILHEPFLGTRAKPRTYRRLARKAFLTAAKAKRLSPSKRRTAIGKQLRYLRRNLGYIRDFIAISPGCLRLLPIDLHKKLLVISEVYRQQLHMYRTKERRIDDRIVNIAQPHVRPIVRGKPGASTEFGAKISVSLVNDLVSLDRLSWDAYNECNDLCQQVENYRARTGFYPTVVYADKIYRTKGNRRWCKERSIRLAGVGPGRPPADPEAMRARRIQAKEDEAGRQPMEGVFGRGKRRFSLKRIMTKLADTSAVAIAVIFLVMNLDWILLTFFVLFAVFIVVVFCCRYSFSQFCNRLHSISFRGVDS